MDPKVPDYVKVAIWPQMALDKINVQFWIENQGFDRKVPRSEAQGTSHDLIWQKKGGEMQSSVIMWIWI